MNLDKLNEEVAKISAAIEDSAKKAQAQVDLSTEQMRASIEASAPKIQEQMRKIQEAVNTRF